MGTQGKITFYTTKKKRKPTKNSDSKTARLKHTNINEAEKLHKNSFRRVFDTLKEEINILSKKWREKKQQLEEIP